MPSAKPHAEKIRRALGSSSPPRQITQEAFEFNPQHLRRLVRLHPGERAEANDLWEYTQDLLYTEIQGSLFIYLLPFCLEAWREDLRGTGNGYGGFAEYFYLVLANKQIFDKHLTQDQTTAVSEFMRESILEEIDDQRRLSYQGMGTRPYRWIAALTTHGVLLPDVDRLWTAWWSLSTVGRAIAVVQYISCLMYPNNENPIFAPWTRDAGGGPRCLWEFGGHLYTHRWLNANVRFIRGILNVGEASAVLNRSVEFLLGKPEHATAAQVQSDLPLCDEILAARCTALPHLLETTQEPGALLDWPK
jgi:hypothetical protein